MSRKTFMEGTEGHGRPQQERPRLTIWPAWGSEKSVPKDLPDVLDDASDEADEPDDGPDYRVLSCHGLTLGRFPTLTLALAAYARWQQAVAVVDDTRVILQRVALGRAA